MKNSVSTIVLWHEKSICRLDEELCTLSHRSACITPVVDGSESDAAMGVAPGDTLPAMKNAGMGEGRGGTPSGSCDRSGIAGGPFFRREPVRQSLCPPSLTPGGAS